MTPVIAVGIARELSPSPDPETKALKNRQCSQARELICLNPDKLFILHMPLILSLLIRSVINTAAEAGQPAAKESAHRRSVPDKCPREQKTA